MSSTNELCGCVDDEECMIDTSCKMGDLGCNAYGKTYCRLCKGVNPLPKGSPDYLPCKWQCERDGTCSANANGIFGSEEECLESCASGRSRDCLKALELKCGGNQRKCLNKGQRDNLAYCINNKRDYSSRGAKIAPYQCYNNGIKDVSTINSYLNSICVAPDHSKCDCPICMVDYTCDYTKMGCNRNGLVYCRTCGTGGNEHCRWKCNDGDCVRDAAGRFKSERECLNSCGN